MPKKSYKMLPDGFEEEVTSLATSLRCIKVSAKIQEIFVKPCGLEIYSGKITKS